MLDCVWSGGSGKSSRPCPRPLVIEPKKPLKPRQRAAFGPTLMPPITLIIGPFEPVSGAFRRGFPRFHRLRPRLPERLAGWSRGHWCASGAADPGGRALRHPCGPVTAPRSRRAASGETDRLAGMPSRPLVRLGCREGLRQQPRPRRRSSVRSAVLGTGRPARSRRHASSPQLGRAGRRAQPGRSTGPAASRPSTGPLIIDA